MREHEVAPQVILASTDIKVIRSWKALLPSSQTLHWMGGSEESLRARIAALRETDFAGVTQLQIHIRQGADAVGKPAIQPSEDFLREVAQELKPRNILFQALPWSGDQPDLYRKLLALGVQSFASDYPNVVVPVMRENVAATAAH